MTTTDRRPDFYRAYETAAAVTGRVEQSQAGLPTPCPELDVSALVDHLVGAGYRAAALGRGEAPGGDAFPHVDVADAPGRLREASDEAQAAWSDDARLGATTTMPWGETYTGATLVDMYLAELAAHTWDLATATGQTLGDDGLADSALEAARAVIRPEYRDSMGPGNPFGPEVEPPTDASAWERFAAFMGRRPRAGSA